MKKSLLNLALIGALLPATLMSHSVLAQDRPLLETTGVSQIQVEPDMAEINVEVSLSESDAKAAKAASDQAVAAFIERLLKAGVAKESIAAANLNLQPEYVYLKDKAPELKGYRASRSVTVLVKQLDQLNPILDSALIGGINKVNQINLKSSKEAEMRKQARQAAIEDAKQKASELAAGFGEKLDGVWSIRYFDQGPVRPVMYKAAMMAEGAINQSYEYGQVTFSDRVEVSYKLRD
ncbi:oxidative stress defense protein [Shewanella algae]|uniref:26 kDa periplasmic immunogenic protein n=2 Tax=Shewanella TaxID=22 RepID=A0A380A658_9GAMM|nr:MULTISPECIES: oxidative stress defense protein [Shewanella]AXQ16527.1 oxidative stress defense protein [Shewanella algae]MBO2592554.1 oxidative stress defense protein [Shewanella algae]MBO2609299.1 oxidative stress defense protein [Shewanella algae]MBZ4677952.1 oxidative stress defense protein [Shewanella sp.]MCA0948603.1 oxidative stress defense protein [Shewanella chilikensis]